MKKKIDLVYNRVVAEDRLRSADRYELLAAFAFLSLEQQGTVHDLRLLASGGVRHQLEIGLRNRSMRATALVECKDFPGRVGLPLVRTFDRTVKRIRPDQAFMVTTRGVTDPAMQYAAANGIRLALLVPPTGEERAESLPHVEVEVNVTVPVENPKLNWMVPEDQADFVFSDAASGRARAQDVRVQYSDGRVETASELIERHVERPQTGEAGVASGQIVFNTPALLTVRDYPELRVSGFKWSQRFEVSPHSLTVGHGIGGLAAELATRTLDRDIDRTFSGRQLVVWTIDSGGHVIPTD